MLRAPASSQLSKLRARGGAGEGDEGERDVRLAERELVHGRVNLESLDLLLDVGPELVDVEWCAVRGAR